MNWYGTSLGEAVVLGYYCGYGRASLYDEEASSEDGHDSGGASGHTLRNQ